MKLVNGERQFRMVKSPMKANRLPKRGSGSVNLIVNGSPTECPVTTNRAWSAEPSKILDYIWIPVTDVAYYVTLDYAESAADWNGAEVQIQDGVASRVDPVRVTAKIEVETTRIVKFKATWEARNAA